MPNDEEVRNGISPQPSGTVHLWVDGKKIRLRNPRLREYRKITDLWRDFSDELEDALRDNAAWLDKMGKLGLEREERGEPRMTPEEKAEDRERGKTATIEQETKVIEWWRLVVDTLGDKELPEDDDLPVFLSQLDGLTTVIAHWRSVPSFSGVQ